MCEHIFGVLLPRRGINFIQLFKGQHEWTQKTNHMKHDWNKNKK